MTYPFDGSQPCRDVDPETFFANSGGMRSAAELSAALDVCRPCPFRAPCLDWALRHPDAAAYGVWGAKTEAQRRILIYRLSRRSGVGS